MLKIAALECTTPKGNPNVNYGLWVTLMYQSKFVEYNKCTTWVQDVNVGFLLELDNLILKNIRKTKKNSKSSRKDGWYCSIKH